MRCRKHLSKLTTTCCARYRASSARYLAGARLPRGDRGCGVCAFGWQIYTGIGVAGIRSPVFWGFYITNFVFWIGFSHAGTLISAILRLCNATWRRPVTRCAEVITVFALSIGATFPVIHLGRPVAGFLADSVPERARHLAQHPLAAALGFFRDHHLSAGQRHFLVAAHDSGSGADSRSRHRAEKENL